ncbi:hypothetical protein PGH42_10620 [Legionella pneumophila]|nr:hypothetical protein PGH42_10620 [Legionella pneumophila]
MTRNKTEKNIQFDFNECLEKAKANELSSLDILNNKDTWDSLSIKQKQRLCGSGCGMDTSVLKNLTTRIVHQSSMDC